MKWNGMAGKQRGYDGERSQGLMLIHPQLHPL